MLTLYLVMLKIIHPTSNKYAPYKVVNDGSSMWVLATQVGDAA